MSRLFNSNKSAGSSMRRQRSRNSSAQFHAKLEGAHDEGKNCSRCGVHDPNVSSKWVGHWNCASCGGNTVSRTVANAGSSESTPGEARRLRFARLRNKQKVPATTFVVSSFLDERPKTVKKVTPKKATPQIKAKAAKELRREAAMAELGLTEADIIKFQGE
jgi:ribosomal protein L37AE/L43A